MLADSHDELLFLRLAEGLVGCFHFEQLALYHAFAQGGQYLVGMLAPHFERGPYVIVVQLDEVFKELVSVTGIADFTKDEITELLTDRVKTLQERGYGDVLALCLKLRDGYEITEKILSAYDAETLTDALETADDVYDKITSLDYSDKNVSKTLVSQALTKLQNAKNHTQESI